MLQGIKKNHVLQGLWYLAVAIFSNFQGLLELFPRVMGVSEGYRRGYGSYRRKPSRVPRVIKGYTVGDNTSRQPGGSDRSYEGYGSYRRDFPGVMGVIPVNNSHNPSVTPITLENPARNSCNPQKHHSRDCQQGGRICVFLL